MTDTTSTPLYDKLSAEQRKAVAIQVVQEWKKSSIDDFTPAKEIALLNKEIELIAADKAKVAAAVKWYKVDAKKPTPHFDKLPPKEGKAVIFQAAEQWSQVVEIMNKKQAGEDEALQIANENSYINNGIERIAADHKLLNAAVKSYHDKATQSLAPGDVQITMNTPRYDAVNMEQKYELTSTPLPAMARDLKREV